MGEAEDDEICENMAGKAETPVWQGIATDLVLCSISERYANGAVVWGGVVPGRGGRDVARSRRRSSISGCNVGEEKEAVGQSPGGY